MSQILELFNANEKKSRFRIGWLWNWWPRVRSFNPLDWGKILNLSLERAAHSLKIFLVVFYRNSVPLKLGCRQVNNIKQFPFSSQKRHGPCYAVWCLHPNWNVHDAQRTMEDWKRWFRPKPNLKCPSLHSFFYRHHRSCYSRFAFSTNVSVLCEVTPIAITFDLFVQHWHTAFVLATSCTVKRHRPTAMIQK